MSKILRIVISEEPQAKGRARTAFINGFVRTYTPQRTLDAQNVIAMRLKRHQEDCFPRYMPVKLTVTFYRRRARDFKKETMPYRKPDLDNLLKLLSDAMIGILVVDDSQLTTIVARKRWSETGEGYITLRLEEDKP